MEDRAEWEALLEDGSFVGTLRSRYGIEVEEKSVVGMPLIVKQVVPFYETVEFVIRRIFRRGMESREEEVCDVIASGYSRLPQLLF